MAFSMSAPTMPYQRPVDHFQEGNRVVCFTKNLQTRLPDVPDFVFGTVAPEMIGAGRVEVKCDVKIQSDPSFLDGHGLSFSLKDPRLMKEAEFFHLLLHPNLITTWTRSFAKELEEALFEAANVDTGWMDYWEEVIDSLTKINDDPQLIAGLYPSIARHAGREVMPKTLAVIVLLELELFLAQHTCQTDLQQFVLPWMEALFPPENGDDFAERAHDEYEKLTA